MPPRVTVVGAGVIGLTCAVRLAESGLAVDVLARDLPLETSSAAGAGLWLPGRPGGGGEREAGALIKPANRKGLGFAVRNGFRACLLGDADTGIRSAGAV